MPAIGQPPLPPSSSSPNGGTTLEQILYKMNGTLGSFSNEVSDLSLSNRKLSSSVDSLGKKVDNLSENIVLMASSGDMAGFRYEDTSSKNVEPVSLSLIQVLKTIDKIDSSRLASWKRVSATAISNVIISLADALNKVGVHDKDKVRNGAEVVKNLTYGIKNLNLTLPLLAAGMGSMVLLTRFASFEEITIGFGIASGALLGMGGILIALGKLGGNDATEFLTNGSKALLSISGATALMSLAVYASASMFENIGGYDREKLEYGTGFAVTLIGATSLIFGGMGKLLGTMDVLAGALSMATIAASIYAFGEVTKHWGETAIWTHDRKAEIESGTGTMTQILGGFSAAVGILAAITIGTGGSVLLGLLAGGGVIGLMHYTAVASMTYAENMLKIKGIDDKLESVGGVSGMSNKMMGWLKDFYYNFASAFTDLRFLSSLAVVNTVGDVMMGRKGVLNIASNFLDVIDKMFNMKILDGFDDKGVLRRPIYKPLSLSFDQMESAGAKLGGAIAKFSYSLLDGLKGVNSKEFLDMTADISNALMGEFKFGFGHAGALAMASKFLDVIDKLGNMKVISSIDEYGNTKFKPLSTSLASMASQGENLGKGIGAFVSAMAQNLSGDLRKEAKNMQHIAQAMIGDSWSLKAIVAGKDAGLLPVITGIVDIIQRIASGKFITYDENGNPKQVIEAKVSDFAGTGVELAKGIGGFIRGLASNLVDLKDTDFDDLIDRMGDVAEVLADDDDGIISIVERIGTIGSKTSWRAFERFRDMTMSVFSTISSTAKMFSDSRKGLYDDMEDVVDDMDDTMKYFGKIVDKLDTMGNVKTLTNVIYAKETMSWVKRLLVDVFSMFGANGNSALATNVARSKQVLKAIAGESDSWWKGQSDGLLDVMMRAVIKAERIGGREEIVFKNGEYFKISKAIEHLDSVLLKNASDRELALSRLTEKLNETAKALSAISENADKIGGLDKLEKASNLISSTNGKSDGGANRGSGHGGVTNISVPNTMEVHLSRSSLQAMDEMMRHNMVLLLSEK